MKHFLIISSLVYLLSGCTYRYIEVRPILQAPGYSFFVAGHTYGHFAVNNKGLHPPFVEKFDLIENHPEIAFGVLTGDITYRGTERDWIEVDSQLLGLDVPTFFTVGNHDIGGPIYQNRYGDTYYRFFEENNGKKDLMLILDPNIDKWNISGDQLVFFYQSLDSAEKIGVQNVFIFCHQLIWWSSAPNNPYRNIGINPTQGIPDSVNFWTDLEPKLRMFPGKVFLFAGDVGAHHLAADFMYHQYANITLIASGMGHGRGDNFIFVNVLQDGKVTFELIALQGDIHSLGKLEDYVLP